MVHDATAKVFPPVRNGWIGTAGEPEHVPATSDGPGAPPPVTAHGARRAIRACPESHAGTESVAKRDTAPGARQSRDTHHGWAGGAPSDTPPTPLTRPYSRGFPSPHGPLGIALCAGLA
jgi:hypothetical protein